jgi:hypothetical protein
MCRLIVKRNTKDHLRHRHRHLPEMLLADHRHHHLRQLAHRKIGLLQA